MQSTLRCGKNILQVLAYKGALRLDFSGFNFSFRMIFLYSSYLCTSISSPVLLYFIHSLLMHCKIICSPGLLLLRPLVSLWVTTCDMTCRFQVSSIWRFLWSSWLSEICGHSSFLGCPEDWWCAAWVWAWYSCEWSKIIGCFEAVALNQRRISISQMRTLHMLVLTKKWDTKEDFATLRITIVASVRPIDSSFWMMLSPFRIFMFEFTSIRTGHIGRGI